jgi:DNA processing protein
MSEGKITIEDKSYPELLKQIKEPPKKLYYKGNWTSEIFENCLAVVGSRRLTSYGRNVAQQIVTELAMAGLTIVSGFMYGGDEVAHSATIKVGGKTIAVMPCGIDIIHPEYQEELYREILEKDGLIISEFEGKFPPAVWTYPKRNRIVAGLSKAVLVIEAGLNSGTLITAGFARRFGRKIFAVPGPLTSEVSRGSNQLIKQGASVVTSAKDILDFYDVRLDKSSVKGDLKKEYLGVKDKIEQEIIEHLKKEPANVDDLARTTKVPVSELSAKLSLMQLKGLIKQQDNKYYIN